MNFFEQITAAAQSRPDIDALKRSKVSLHRSKGIGFVLKSTNGYSRHSYVSAIQRRLRNASKSTGSARS